MGVGPHAAPLGSRPGLTGSICGPATTRRRLTFRSLVLRLHSGSIGGGAHTAEQGGAAFHVDQGGTMSSDQVTVKQLREALAKYPDDMFVVTIHPEQEDWQVEGTVDGPRLGDMDVVLWEVRSGWRLQDPTEDHGGPDPDPEYKHYLDDGSMKAVLVGSLGASNLKNWQDGADEETGRHQGFYRDKKDKDPTLYDHLSPSELTTVRVLEGIMKQKATSGARREFYEALYEWKERRNG